jgi:hypothetical protein
MPVPGCYGSPGADVAQSVEHQLPKLRVAGSIPVVRSRFAAQSEGRGYAGGYAEIGSSSGFPGEAGAEKSELDRSGDRFIRIFVAGLIALVLFALVGISLSVWLLVRAIT